MSREGDCACLDRRCGGSDLLGSDRAAQRDWSASATWQFVAALLASPGGLAVLIPTQRHGDEAAEVIAELPHLAGHLTHDAHTAILMREHGIARICTWGTDSSRFPFVEVIDPLGSTQATD
jgi:uncharacterized protein